MSRRDSNSDRTRFDNRAVSEVVGFILVFAVIFGSVGLLYFSGFQAMEDYQQTEQEVNAERAMEALTDNFNDVLRYDGIDQRQGEISLREGQIAVGDRGTQLDIYVDSDGNNRSIGNEDAFESFYNDDDRIDLGEFTYTSASRTVAYEGGGLVRSDDSSGWSDFFERPYISCGDETATITLAQVTSDSQSRQSAGGVELSITEENRSTVVYEEVDSVTIQVDDSTAYDAAWDEILDEDGVGGCLDNELERVVVTLVEVDIEY